MNLPILQICATSLNIDKNITFMNLTTCGVESIFGLDWTLAAIVTLGLLAALAYYARIPAKVSVGFGLGVLYMFDLMAGGSQILQMGIVLMGVGWAIMVGLGLFSYVKEYS